MSVFPEDIEINSIPERNAQRVVKLLNAKDEGLIAELASYPISLTTPINSQGDAWVFVTHMVKVNLIEFMNTAFGEATTSQDERKWREALYECFSRRY